MRSRRAYEGVLCEAHTQTPNSRARAEKRMQIIDLCVCTSHSRSRDYAIFLMTAIMDDLNSEQTLPPARAIRFDRVSELYGAMPEIAKFIQSVPEADEGYRGFLERLRASETPEDAVTFTAFSLQTKAGIRWGVECVQALVPEMPAEDSQLMGMISDWLTNGSAENRWKALEVALFAPRRSAAVYLGLAVGWAEGPLAPNDLVTVPAWRSPRAVSSAIMRAVGQTRTENRTASLDFVLDRAAGLLRIN